MEKMISVVASFSLSLCIGYYSGRSLALEPVLLSVQPDTRPGIPVVHIDGMRHGKLHGSVYGEARLSIGNTVIVQSGAFAVAAEQLLTNEILVHIPAWAQFVASKRGKKYYSVTERAGQNITPTNRVYFTTTAEAELAGYRR